MVKQGFFLFLIILTGTSFAMEETNSSRPLYSPAAAALLSKVGMDAYAIDAAPVLVGAEIGNVEKPGVASGRPSVARVFL